MYLTECLNWTKMKGNCAKRLGLSRQIWTTGITLVVLQSCLGTGKAMGAAGELWAVQSQAVYTAPWNPWQLFLKIGAGTWWPPILASLWPRTIALTALWSGLTAFRGSTLKSLQLCSYETPSGTKKNEWAPGIQLVPCESFSQGKNITSFFLDPDTWLRNESSGKKKKGKPNSILDCVSHFGLVFKIN